MSSRPRLNLGSSEPPYDPPNLIGDGNLYFTFIKQTGAGRLVPMGEAEMIAPPRAAQVGERLKGDPNHLAFIGENKVFQFHWPVERKAVAALDLLWQRLERRKVWVASWIGCAFGYLARAYDAGVDLPSIPLADLLDLMDEQTAQPARSDTHSVKQLLEHPYPVIKGLVEQGARGGQTLYTLAQEMWRFTAPRPATNVNLTHPAVDRVLGLGLGSARLGDFPVRVARDGRARQAWQALNFLQELDTNIARWLLGGDDVLPPVEVEQTFTQAISNHSADASPDLLHGLSRALLEEVATHADFAVFGAYEVDVPADTLLHDVGGRRIRFYAGQHHFAVGLANDAGQPLRIMPWTPLLAQEQSPVPTGLDAILNFATAALWRDLSVAGDMAVPSTSTTPGDRDPDIYDNTRGARRTTSPLRLCRRIFTGTPHRARRWGTVADHEAIRVTHGVRGHYRAHVYVHEAAAATGDEEAVTKLAGVRAAAAQRARQAGLPPPPQGFTFVVPFVRGNADSAPPRAVIARGLLLLSTLGAKKT